MRQADKKYFGDIQQGRLNADDSPFVVGNNEWVNAENIRTGSTDKGFTGIVESIGGNVQLPEPPSAKAYFFNVDFSPTGGYFQLGSSQSTTELAFIQIDNSTSVSYITDIGEPNLTSIDAGEWNIYCNLSNFRSTTTPIVYAEIYIYHQTGLSTLISTTNSVSITNTSFESGYNLKASIPQQTILDTDRIVIKFVGENITGSGAYVIFYPQAKGEQSWHSYILTNLSNSTYDYTTIGSIEDTENKRIIYFNYDNSALRQDRITCFDLQENKQYNVLLSSQIRGRKYLSTEYNNLPVSTYTLTTGINTSLVYNMVFSQASKTISITPLNPSYLVDINLNIGDSFAIRGTTNNNNLFTVVNIVRGAELTTITIAESLINETSTTGFVVYLNQLKFDSSAVAFLNFIKTGYKLVISNSTFSGTYIVQDSDPQNYIVYIDSYVSNIGFLLSSTIEVYNPIINYENGLGFSKDSLIHSAKISNLNILSWVDGTNNEPRKINIESGILANDSTFDTKEKAYQYPLDFSEITLIKPPPAIAPIAEKVYKSGSVNLIRYESFEFAFQFIYNDNEITVPGTYSLGTRLNNATDTQQFNAISVSMSYQQDIPSNVKTINLICRISDGKPTGGTNASVIYKWQKSIDSQKREIDLHNNNVSQLNYVFYNDIVGEAIPADDTLRQFDNVPIFSQTHEVSKSRYFLANNIEGYDTPKETSLYSRIGGNTITSIPSLSITAQGIKVGYFREHGSNWSVIGYYIYVNNIGANRTGYYLINGTEQNSMTNADANTPGSFTNPINFTNLTWGGSTLNEIAQDVMNRYGRSGAFDSRGGIVESGWANTTATLTGFDAITYGTIANNSKYKLGIAFYDYAMRKCGVCINNNNPQNYYKVISNLIVANGINHPSSLSGNYLYINFGQIVPDIIENDLIAITSTTNFNALYTVSNVFTKYITSSNHSVYTLQISTPTVHANVSLNETGAVSVFRNQNLDISSPIRDYQYKNAYGEIDWYLNNINNTIQIPEWAYYYSVVKTLNLKTRFLFESETPKSNGLVYVTKDNNGLYSYSSTIYTVNAVAIGVNTTNLNYSGLGYTYSNGDICTIIFFDGRTYNLPVIGQDGNYILLQASNIGNLPSNTGTIFQIYTPYKSQSEQEPYYEISETFPINNPSTPIRSFSKLNGKIPADSYVILRNAPPTYTYYANAMSPNDTFWKRWDSDAGKPNIITTLGQIDKNTNITWSDTYISGTKINGSSTFRLGGETFVSDDCGSITKLQLTSKVQDQGQGSVMLALCNSEINSIYLGETQITDSTGKTQFFSASQGVISTINVLKGNYGCISPESVVQYRGKVYFVDLSNGRVVQYSDNGLDAISNIKMSRFWKNWAYKYQSMTKAEIEAFGDRPYIFSIVDSGHDELLISLPKLSNDPPKGFLPDYPNTIYPFDILDYQGKTMVYCLGTAAQVYPHWQGSYTFTTENFVAVQNRLFSFKNGKIYEHNQDAQNVFYGSSSPSRIMFTSNILSQVPKVYDNFVSESNLMPSFVYFYNDYPYIQTSDLANVDFRNLEGIWYANILRNKIVPTATGFTIDGLLTAEVMRNTNMYVEVDFYPNTETLELRLLQLGMSISKGHTIT